MISVILKETNVWIGFCGLCKEKDSWDFGYSFLKNYWGQGYASEAVEACSDYLKKISQMKITILNLKTF